MIRLDAAGPARDARERLHRAADGLGDLEAVSGRVADAIADRARRRAPRRTGRLAQSIRIDPAGPGVARVVAGGSGVPYAQVIHAGSAARGIRPNPFLVDALEDVTPDLEDWYADGITEVLERTI